ncbi:flagellar filament capping protein FliD [Pseudomonas matsuisoli]|uniref:Flagellar hook-associated protein 2 n=1 Tax=Pseudomonas matsuisoli TaxID=1515666 RepID=A0A917PIZ0_9PSED|nr:flagellar filament capping protein FliD [Pseudomonas matsuisoli]GGJ80485.1 B-type flagellar hook-associated protein 2 [Pseudomonas matsuisoli]
MAVTTISGFNSGLDISGIVTAMVNAEKAPKADQLSKLQTKTTAQISGLGSLKSGIANLQTVMKDLNSAKLFQGRTATSSDSTLVSATASTTAAQGSYKLSVTSLATASSVASAPLDKENTFAAGGSLTISLGGDALKTVSLRTDKASSLSDVSAAINAQLKDEGITATVVTDPSTNQSRLMLTSSKMGDGKDITLAGAGDLAKLDVAARPEGSTSNIASNGAQYISMASNAKFSINGLELQSASNTVDNAIEGVTLTLTAPTTVTTTVNGASTTTDKPITLTVAEDKAGVKTNIKKFVDAYNSLITTTSTQTQVTKVGDDKSPIAGALVGDSGVRQLLSTMRTELGNAQPGGDGSVRILADLGITTGKDGKLVIDDTKLTKALDTNFEGVAGFFTGDNGLMSRMNSKLDVYTQTGGILETRISGLNGTIKSIDKQNEALTLRMDRLQTRLLAQFNAMDSLVGQMSSTSNSLAGALASLPGVVGS